MKYAEVTNRDARFRLEIIEPSTIANRESGMEAEKELSPKSYSSSR